MFSKLSLHRILLLSAIILVHNWNQSGAEARNLGNDGGEDETREQQKQRCPDKCKCLKPKVVDCQRIGLTNSKLETLVKKIPNDTEVLHLGSNQLTDFSLSVLQSLQKLQQLDLQLNQLQRLPANRHGYVITLQEINMDKNNITELRSKDFLGYGALESLFLIRNRISKIGGHDLRNLIRIREIYFDNNLIRSIHKDAFKRNKNLKYVHFSDNKIEIIQPGLFDNLPYLSEAIFHNNEIHSIPDMVVSRSSRIIHLDLSHNRLREIPEHAFANMSNFGIIDIQLSRNLLTSLQSSSFQNSEQLYVDISTNNLHCDCSLNTNLEKIASTGDVTLEGGECSTPPSAKGLHIEHLMVQGEMLGCVACDQVTCNNKGKCVILDPFDKEIQCECQPGYEGKQCERRATDKLTNDVCENNRCSEYETCIPLNSNKYNCTCSGSFQDGICMPSAKSSNKEDTMSTAVWIIIVTCVVVVVVGVFVGIYIAVSRKKRRTLLVDDFDVDDNEL